MYLSRIKMFTFNILNGNTSVLFHNQYAVANTTWIWTLRNFLSSNMAVRVRLGRMIGETP